MKVSRTIQQAPAPKVFIFDKETRDITNKKLAKLSFSPVHEKILQSYSFSLSVGDVAGSFNLMFFPETIGGKHLFDEIGLLDIVVIYEQSAISNEEPKPVFTGIIRTKKYTSQASEGGASRRFSVSGTAITGLITQFWVNLDVRAVALSKQMATDRDIAMALTLSFERDNQTVEDVIKTVWKYFEEVATQIGNVTIGIREILDNCIGINRVFDIPSGLKIDYKLGCLFSGEATQDFFSIIDGIIPEPVYEKFAYADKDGVMRIKIRRCPFNAEDWTSIYNRKIIATELKSFDLTETDAEVYTVFYSYVEGSHMEADRGLILSTMKEKGVPSTLRESDMYNLYGYRPLICTFLGYGKADGEEETDLEPDIGDLNAELAKWFGNLNEMLSGSITLAMTYNKKPIMPGEVIGFLGGEFYVEGINHSWNYGAGGEISLSVSRGGKYDNGKFSKLEKISSASRLLERGES